MEKGTGKMTEMDSMATRTPECIYTVGHSRHSPEHLLKLLRQQGVALLVDVRSRPYSRYVPHFNRSQLQSMIRQSGLTYHFMGEVLGGYPESREFYDEKDEVDYGQLAASPQFLAGIGDLKRIAGEQCIALMCSEEDPLRCHRFLLLGRLLVEHGISVKHIRSDGRVQTQDELEEEGSIHNVNGSGAVCSPQQHCQQQLFPDAGADADPAAALEKNDGEGQANH